jgi:hypothetical protein
MKPRIFQVWTTLMRPIATLARGLDEPDVPAADLVAGDVQRLQLRQVLGVALARVHDADVGDAVHLRLDRVADLLLRCSCRAALQLPHDRVDHHAQLPLELRAAGVERVAEHEGALGAARGDLARDQERDAARLASGSRSRASPSPSP